MANSRKASGKRFGIGKALLWLLLIVALIAGVLAYAFRELIHGYASVGTAYAARVGCSCRFVAGRDLEDCEKDKLGGMELVTLVEDVEAKSVTARFPLVTSSTASFREGYGCVLEEWEE